MEKIKVSLVLLLVHFAASSQAQNFKSPAFVKKHLMEVSLGLTGGVMISNPVQELFINGNFSYCMEDQIAVRADFFLFLPDPNFKGQLDRNNSFLLGAEFHFPFNRFDLSMVFQPGLSLCYLEGGSVSAKTQAEPVVQLGLEASYYILQNFHVFANGSYIHGDYFLESQKPFKLDELRLTVGAGINIFVNHTALFQRKVVKF